MAGLARNIMGGSMYSISLARREELPCLPTIEELASALFLRSPLTADLPSDPTPLADFEEAQQAGLLWVARIDTALPVGFALAQTLGDELHLEELDVLPEHGRRGIGAALVQKVCERALGHGRSVTLCTFSEIPWNAAFYERLGFRRLRAEELTPALRARMREEAERGLRPELRVAMRFRPF